MNGSAWNCHDCTQASDLTGEGCPATIALDEQVTPQRGDCHPPGKEPWTDIALTSNATGSMVVAASFLDQSDAGQKRRRHSEALHHAWGFRFSQADNQPTQAAPPTPLHHFAQRAADQQRTTGRTLRQLGVDERIRRGDSLGREDAKRHRRQVE